ncbi:MAG: dipeptide epimerase [Candidatus Limnocylindrales bacterium]|nr:dipeptide epimerase [Candidatus Limnocylindrales bacterium]
MTLRLTQEILHLGLRDPFRIARSDHGAGHEVTTVIVEVRDERFPDLVGVGEGYPDRFYGETPDTMAAVFPLLIEAIGAIEPTADGLDAMVDAMDQAIRGHGAARCALDIALHDLVGKVVGVPVHELLGLSADLPPTDFTIGIDAPDVVAERARRAAGFPALKIKVGGPGDLATLEAVRDVYDGPIRVDANTGWTPEDALAILPDLERLGVELIEQPFPARRLDQLRWLQERSALPIVADESCVFQEDLEGLVGVVAGVNVKLAKCGGVGPARRMLERARELGFRTFLGCMEETSVGIAGSAVVASLAEWVDLDGCLLLADDPFAGLELDAEYRWRLSDKPGLGLSRRAS